MNESGGGLGGMKVEVVVGEGKWRPLGEKERRGGWGRRKGEVAGGEG